MEKDYLSLVFFTVLGQTAAGSLILREILIHSVFNYQPSREFRVISLLVTGIIIALALITAFLHLGKQASSVYALRNLRNSWLSREILFVIIFSITVLLYWLNERFWNVQALKSMISVAGVVSGIAFLASMSAIYMLPAVPSWNSALTPFSFILTALSGGISILILLNAVYGSVPDKKLLAILAGAILLSSLIPFLMFRPGFDSGFLTILILKITLSITALLLIYLIYFTTLPNKIPVLTVLFIAVLLTEFAGRVLFFMNYNKSGL